METWLDMQMQTGLEILTKHIDIHYHYVREAVQRGIMGLQNCPTEDMVTDLLTKSLPRGQLETLRSAMGV